jgi:hypothetical protein
MVQPTELATIVDELSRQGVMLSSHPGIYRVNFKTGGTAATLFETEDLSEAIARARFMATQPQAKPQPPLGPLGPRRTSKGRMYRHNRALAARRARQAKKN